MNAFAPNNLQYAFSASTTIRIVNSMFSSDSSFKVGVCSFIVRLFVSSCFSTVGDSLAVSVVITLASEILSFSFSNKLICPSIFVSLCFGTYSSLFSSFSNVL